MTTSLPSFISFTGADDNTNIKDLIRLDEKWGDKIEFGILYFPEKQGQPRNPSQAWIDRLHLDAPWLSTTAHICGKQFFQDVLNDPEHYYTQIPDLNDIADSGPLSGFDRVQLNINARNADFTPVQVWEIYQRLYNTGREMILQYNEQSAPTIDEWFRVNTSLKKESKDHFPVDFFYKLHLLHDTSRGRGIYCSQWPIAEDRAHLSCIRRYAGGIKPENVLQAALEVSKARGLERGKYVVQDQPWALDLESGCRDAQNCFDIEKVEAIMKKVYG